MRILALEPYYGGSHRAFIDGWIANSRHDWTLLKLAANKWKWRMRHAAVTFADELNQLGADGRNFDAIFCSDMLNLAEFLGLVDTRFRQIPVVAYFHENQLTYPVRFESERDYQFAMTNMTCALAATCVWFNSAFHRDEFLSALTAFLKRMPDNQPFGAVEKIRSKSAIHAPGIAAFPKRAKRKPGPARILWAARWEHDKNPDDFFQALKNLKESRADFRLSVIGRQFREMPDVFTWAKEFFAEYIDQWGYLPSREEYESALSHADIVVSTANHEFFGIGIVEAIAAGVYPVLPDRLSYPEIIKGIDAVSADEFLYDGTVEDLVAKLQALIPIVQDEKLWRNRTVNSQLAMRRYAWSERATKMDDDLDNMVTAGGKR